MVGPSGIAPWQDVGVSDVDLRFPGLHMDLGAVLPKSFSGPLSQLFVSVPLSQLLVSPSLAYRNILEGKRWLLVIYIVGEGKPFSSPLLA